MTDILGPIQLGLRYQQNPSLKDYFEQWGMGECGLLIAARHKWQEMRRQDRRRVNFVRLWDQSPGFQGLITALQAQHWAAPLRARQQCLEALFARNKKTKLAEALQTYHNEAWHYQIPSTLRDRLQIQSGSCSQSHVQIRRISAYRRLPETWQPLVEQAAMGSGWMDPAVLLAAETLAWILADEIPKPTASVQVWIAFQLQTGGATAGRLGKLTLERIPNGNGALIPHPLRQAHCRLDPEGNQHFLEGLHQAWWREIGSRLGPPQTSAPIDYDIWWTLRPMPSENGEAFWPHLVGRSGEVAMGNALRALRDGVPLDPTMVVSAQYRDNFPEVVDEHELIKPVGGIADKVTATAFDPSGAPLGVNQFVTSADSVWLQPPNLTEPFGEGRRLSFDQGRKTLIGLQTVDQQWRLVSLEAGITAKVKTYLAQRARSLLAAECAPFVEPHLYEPVREEGPQSQQEKRRLEGPAVRARLLQGGRRLLIRGDSGMGKSMLLVWAEALFAESGRPVIPVRLGAGPREASHPGGLTPDLPRWSELFLDDSREEQPQRLKKLRERLFFEVMRPILQSVGIRMEGDGTQYRQWFEQRIERGEIAWILDALDQSGGAKLSGVQDLVRHLASNCAIILTARHELTPDEQQLLRENWEAVEIAEFDPTQLHEFLEEDGLRQQLLIQAKDHPLEAAYARKQQWQDLLKFPILARAMKDLARQSQGAGDPTALEGLRNREAIYEATLGQVIERTVKNLTPQEQREYADWLDQLDTLMESIAQLAWQSLWQDSAEWAAAIDSPAGGFDGAVRLPGQKAVKRWMERKKFPRELFRKLNLIRKYDQILEAGPMGKRSVQRWRHKSFGEWFAGQHLVRSRQARSQLASLLQDARWRDTVRYALSAAARQGQTKVLNELVRTLISQGRVFWVWEALSEDALGRMNERGEPNSQGQQNSPTVGLERDLELLCRWLVHRDWGWEGDGREAWTKPCPFQDLESTVNLWPKLFDREVRDGRVLFAAWELVELGRQSSRPEVQKVCEEIRRKFLAEWRAIQRGEDPVNGAALNSQQLAALRSLVWDSERDLVPVDRQKPVSGPRYCRVPPEGAKHCFVMGSPRGEPGRFDDEAQHTEEVEAFWLGNFPVTNGAYELYDPGHRERRTTYSSGDLQPVVNVSRYEVELLCVWLGGEYRLPTEAEWEAACRAGTKKAYWYGPEPEQLAEHAWFEDNSGGRTHDLQETLAKGRQPRAGHVNPWGLVDMHGNVWEWCAGDAPLGQPCPFRGGSWDNYARDCRAAFRRAIDPEIRFDFLGLRLVPSPSVVQEGAQPEA